jgi:hypothetical protein
MKTSKIISITGLLVASFVFCGTVQAQFFNNNRPYVTGAQNRGNYATGNYANRNVANGTYANGNYANGAYTNRPVANGNYPSRTYNNRVVSNGNYANRNYANRNYPVFGNHPQRGPAHAPGREFRPEPHRHHGWDRGNHYGWRGHHNRMAERNHRWW